MTIVKICGIITLEDARCAAEAGADLLGFIFYPGSPRYVSPAAAGEIVARIRADFAAARPRFVGVFVDSSEAEIRAALVQARLDYAQLHGEEPPAAVQVLQPYAFKALRPRNLSEARAALRAYDGLGATILRDGPVLLVDAYVYDQPGGTGLRAETTIARWLSSRCRLLLAGGLTPENVAAAIAEIAPWGVDVSSGVEATKGIKDHDRVRAFVRAVREADRASVVRVGG